MPSLSSEAAETAPDVSVVVIVYNDAERLPVAVRSVLDQSLRTVEVIIADDCSTDGSFEVARSLEAAHPGRVRALRLPENSGGCGEPRNQGIAVARGRYVMFLDSDDTLESDACRNMFEAAERTGSDLVSGVCVRVYVDSRDGKETDWYPALYRSTRTVESIEEVPELLYDTLSTNKCYRRDFLLENDLRFPRGIHYEDLLFSAQAYITAKRITLIPNRVYFWNVVQKSEVKSISNRRDEIRNFSDRVEIHRRIDAVLAAHGLDELKQHKDRKFLKHDMVLYLRELPFLGEEYRNQFTEIARDYLRGFPDEAYAETNSIQRICSYLLVQGDWANLMPAIDTLINRQKLSAPLVERDGRIYWCAEHLDDPRGRRILDVTDLGYHGRPLAKMKLRNRLTSYTEQSGTVAMSGTVVNPLGRITPDSKLKATLEFLPRNSGARPLRFPVGAVRHEGDVIAWEAEAPLSRKLRPVGVVDPVWNVRLKLTVDGVSTLSRITVGDTELPEQGTIRIRPRLTRLVADHLEPEVSTKHHLAFVLSQQGKAAQRAMALMHRNLDGFVGRPAKAGYRMVAGLRKSLNSGPVKVRMYHRMLRVLPVRKGTVVFESQLGKQYSDSPRAIYEELRRRNVKFRPVWSYADRPEDFPADARLVRRWSYRHLRALAQAEYWIDNQGMPLKLGKRRGTTYIQTWHGSALKRMGFDEAVYRMKPEAEREAYQRSLDRFDHFVLRSEHDARTLARAYRVPEEKWLRTGYPRNDALVRGRNATTPDPAVQALAERLGIRKDLPVVLYAPTFRAQENGKVAPFEFAFDLQRFVDELGDRCTLLVRTHYLNQVTLPPSVGNRVVNVSDEHDITPLYLLADALVTDYSSVMFDYALLQRPMVFFAYDWEEYAKDARGTYFDLLEQAPGPVVRDADGLFAALADLDGTASAYSARLKEFVEAYGEYDQGDAAARIVDRFFGAKGEPR